MPAPNPIAATPDALRKTLGRRPVLWVGAGTSIAAGHPSTWALVEAMIAEADDPIDPALTFEQAADAFVASQGAGALEDLLQRQLGASLPLTDLHRALARQAAAGAFAAIVTTNYDDLVERALGEAESGPAVAYCQALGRLDQASTYLGRAVEAKTGHQGQESADVATSLHELAGVLQAQGDLSGAREKLERVLEIEEKVYGTRDHYSTAITEMVLGFLLLELEEKEAAAALLAHAYRVFLGQLGPEHPYTRQLAPLFERRDEPEDDG